MDSIQSVNVLQNSSKFFISVDEQSGSSDEFGKVKTKLVKSLCDELVKGNYCAALVMHIGLYIFGFGLGTKGFSFEDVYSDANVQPYDLKESLESGLAFLCIEQWKQPESGKGKRPLVWGQGVDVGARINKLWSGKVASPVETYKHVGGREFFDKKWPGGEGLDDFEKGQRLLRILYPKEQELVNDLSKSDVSAAVDAMNKMVEQSICPGTAELCNLSRSWKTKWSMVMSNGIFCGNTSQIIIKLKEMLDESPGELTLEIFKQSECSNDTEPAQRDEVEPSHNDPMDYDKEHEDFGRSVEGDVGDDHPLDKVLTSESGDGDDAESTMSTATPRIVRKLREGSHLEVEDLKSIIDSLKDPNVHSDLSGGSETGSDPPRGFAEAVKNCVIQDERVLKIAKSRIWINHLFLGIYYSTTENLLTNTSMEHELGWDPDHRKAARMIMSLYVRICDKTHSEEVSLCILLLLSGLGTSKWKSLRNIAQSTDAAEKFINDIVKEVNNNRSQYENHVCRELSILKILVDKLGTPVAWIDIDGRIVNAKEVLDSLHAKSDKVAVAATPSLKRSRDKQGVTNSLHPKKRMPNSSSKSPEVSSKAAGKKPEDRGATSNVGPTRRSRRIAEREKQ